MIRSKILDMDDLKRDDLSQVNNLFNAQFGYNWPEVPCRQWEYCSAILYSGVLATKGNVLDVGCGASIFPAFLKKIGCNVWAFDPRVSDNNTDGICYRNRSMTDLGEFAGHFDIIYAMSSIEHVNAGAYAIAGMEFDTGDTEAMLEMCRCLKPGGMMIITTDFADKYYEPPGLWPNGHHRIYDLESIHSRLIIPAIRNYPIRFWGQAWLDKKDWSDIRQMEPIGYDYTEVILTLKKMGNKKEIA